MKEQLELLQSFDPAERAQAGQQLVSLGVNRCAEPLLDHVPNEFDNRVLAAIAAAVAQAPAEPKESRRAHELREWALAELERSKLEEAFMGGEPDAVAFPPPPDFGEFPAEREALPVRVPVAAGGVGAAEAEVEPIEYRFEVPEPAPEPIEYRVEPSAPEPGGDEIAPGTPEPVEYEPEPAPPEPIEYRFEAPAPVEEYHVEVPPEPAQGLGAPPFISWRPPVDTDFVAPDPSGNGNGNGNGHAHTNGNGNGHVHTNGDGQAHTNGDGDDGDDGVDLDALGWPQSELVAPALEAQLVDAGGDAEAVEYDFEPAEPTEYRFAAPAPLEVEAPAASDNDRDDKDPDDGEYRFEPGPDHVQEYRFEDPAPTAETEELRLEPPAPNQTTPDSANGGPRTLAERLRARNA